MSTGAQHLASRPRALLVIAIGLALAWPAGGQAQEARVGTGPSAFAGVQRVGLAIPAQRGIVAGGGFSYGYTEGVLGLDDSHHRLAVPLAASVRPLPFLAAAVRLDGRYDAHSGTGIDGDSGFAGSTELAARADTLLGERIGVGGELRLNFPAAENAGKGLAAISFDMELLGTYLLQGGTVLGAKAGFRLDRTKEAVEDFSLLSVADAMSVGASDSHAVLFGFAVSHPVGPVDLLGEFSWDMYTGAPAASPIWLRAGARYWLGDAVELTGLLGISPRGTPPRTGGIPIVPVEPRVSVGLAAALHLPFDRPQEREAEAARAQVAAPVAAAPPAATAKLAGKIAGLEGAALENLQLRIGEGEAAVPVPLDADGAFSLADLRPGTYNLHITADGMEPLDRPVEVAEGAEVQVELVLTPTLPEGQIRGTVRSFGGKALRASVRIEPLGQRMRTDGEGSFEIDVAPGDYTVKISAPGYRSQERPAKVDKDGVTVIIVDLKRAK